MESSQNYINDACCACKCRFLCMLVFRFVGEQLHKFNIAWVDLSVKPVNQPRRQLGVRSFSKWYHIWSGACVSARKNRLALNIDSCLFWHSQQCKLYQGFNILMQWTIFPGQLIQLYLEKFSFRLFMSTLLLEFQFYRYQQLKMNHHRTHQLVP